MTNNTSAPSGGGKMFDVIHPVTGKSARNLLVVGDIQKKHLIKWLLRI